MNVSSLKRFIPNLVTCIGLATASYAIFLIMDGELIIGGALVLVTALMDGIDGELARRLHASSELGMQLDSLADVVCFGVAPAVLMTEYMGGTNPPSPIIWFSAVVFVLCSALRLARYNTTIADDVLKDSFGLPTTVAGSFLALLVYLDYETSGKFLALWFIPFAAISLGALMVSKIRFISKTGNTKLTVLSLAATAILGIFVSLPLAGLVFLSIHTAHGLSRAVWRWWRRVRQTQQDKKRLTHPPLF